MRYTTLKDGTRVSALGYGCMRFEKHAGRIDIDKAEREVLLALEQGVNYFDTAYIYGGNEAALGEIMERNALREQMLIADKLPHYLVRKREGLDKKWEEMRGRLRTDFIDFFLLHMLTDTGSWQKLCEMGIEDWIAEKKKSGQIRHIGFSYHGSAAMFIQLMDAYDWDFCMIQYNYLDETSQAGKSGLRYAASKGVPVMIMEPLRGGRLCENLPREALQRMEESGRGWSPAEWSLRWLWDQPEVSCVLSGMHSADMISENVRTAEAAEPGSLTEADQAVIADIKKAILKNTMVPCTGCGYCMPCPVGVDIPGSFFNYNLLPVQKKKKVRANYMQSTIMRQTPSNASRCVACGKCMTHCPQAIDIPTELKNTAAALENPVFHAANFAIQKLKLW